MRYCSPLFVAVALLAACGGETPPVEAPKAPAPAASSAPVVEAPAPEASAEPAPETPPPAEPAAPEGPTTRPPSGRPPILMSSEEEITNTFGMTPAAKLELGDDKARAVLRIPEYAFDRAVNVTFKIDKKGKSTGQVIGRIYHTMTQYAGAEDFRNMDSQSTPFIFEMPAGSHKEANLAIGEILVGEGGREKVTWRVIAPKRIDDVTNTAIFELTTLGDFYLHVTTKKPDAPKP